MKLVDQIREVRTALREAVDQVPDQIGRWLLKQHRPEDVMGDGSVWCLRCRRPWPCDGFVRLDAEIASRSGEQPPPTRPGESRMGGGEA